MEGGSVNRIYVAGPMSGLPEFNYPAFNAEAARLRALGWHVENPAENPEQTCWENYLRLGIAQLVTCHIIALLPGWTRSRGAQLEVDIAQQIGIVVADARHIKRGPAVAG